MQSVHGTNPDSTICVLGLGYVGLTLAAVMADAGFKVIGVEIRDEVVDRLRRCEPHFHEPGLEDMLRRVVRSGRFECHKRIPADCQATVFIITVGTPLDDNGRARLDMVESIAREVAGHLRDDSLVIMRSTVKLGTTRNLVLPILAASRKRAELAFCPERTIEGYALKELRALPQIIGADRPETSFRAARIFSVLTPTVVRVSSIEAAEMIKLVDNVQRDVHFAFANEVADMCDAAGISAAEVIKAGKLGYPRTNLPMPGPVGGPCLSKDPYIFAEAMAQWRAVPAITLAARRTNEAQPMRVASMLRAITGDWCRFSSRPVISLLGLAFKGRPETDDLRGTMAGPIRDALAQCFPAATLRGFDPIVPADRIAAFGLQPAASLADAFAGASLVLILNNHPMFEAMPVVTLAERLERPGLIYDFWNNFNAEALELPADTGYMALGSRGTATLPGDVGRA